MAELENVEIKVKSVSGVYSYVVPGYDYQEAARILKASIGDLISGDDSAKRLTHKMVHNDMGERELLCVKDYPACQALVNVETDQRCGDIANFEDENFAYPLCERHATTAYACIDADADMLANAY